METLKEFLDFFQKCLDTAETANFPDKAARTQCERKFVDFFTRTHQNDDMTSADLADLAECGTVYLTYKMVFAQSLREFDVESTNLILHWTLCQCQTAIFAPECVSQLLLFRGIIGGIFKRKTPKEVLSDFDEALSLANQMGWHLQKAEIYHLRIHPLVQLGRYNEAEESSLEAIRLRAEHEKSLVLPAFFESPDEEDFLG